jgi:O-antigen/teichoic acid export membrane protein
LRAVPEPIDTPQQAESAKAGVVVKRTALLTGAQFGSQALSALWLLVLVRLLGVSEFGVFALASGLSALGNAVADPGLSQIGVRDLTRSLASEGRYLANILILRIALSAVAIGSIAVYAISSGYPFGVKVAIIALSTTLMLDAGKGAALVGFRARQRLEIEAEVVIFLRLASIGLSASLIFIGWSAISVISVYVIAAGLASALALARLARLNIRLDFSGVAWHAMKPILASALPLGIGLTVSMAYYRIDLVLLGQLSGLKQVGLYAAAGKMAEAVFVAQGPAVIALLPLLTRQAQVSREALSATVARAVSVSVLVGLGVFLWFAILGEPTMRLVYGSGFAGGAPMLTILAASAVLMLGNNILIYCLIAMGRQLVVPINATVLLALNVGLNLVLVPRMGGIGAAYSTLATEAALAFAALFWLRRDGLAPTRIYSAPVVAMLSVWVAWYALARLSPTLAAVGSALVLICIALVTRTIDAKRTYQFTREAMHAIKWLP